MNYMYFFLRNVCSILINCFFSFVANEDALSKCSFLDSCKKSALYLSVLLTSVCRRCLPLLHPLRFWVIVVVTSYPRSLVLDRWSTDSPLN